MSIPTGMMVRTVSLFMAAKIFLRMFFETAVFGRTVTVLALFDVVPRNSGFDLLLPITSQCL